MWPFRSRTALTRPPPKERWRHGDVAECVRDDWRAPHPGPARGARLLVIAVRPGHAAWRRLGYGLQLVGYPGLWDADGFRKIIEPPVVAERRATVRVPA